MNRISHAIQKLYEMENYATQECFLNSLNSLAKLIVTVAYLITVISVPKYDVTRVAGMVMYPLVCLLISEFPIWQTVRKTRYIIPIVILMGIANPWIDTRFITQIGQVTITGGILSWITLMVKGFLTVLSAYLFIMTTTIDSLCQTLCRLHIPEVLVNVIWLTFRYLYVLLLETEKLIQAYALRAPGQRGIHIKVWGSLVGQLLLRSIDRAQEVYQSMELRGYGYGVTSQREKEHFKGKDWLWTGSWLIAFVIIHRYPVYEMLGQILMYK